MWLNSQKNPVKGHVEDHSAAELAYYRRVNESIILDPQRMNLIILKKNALNVDSLCTLGLDGLWSF